MSEIPWIQSISYPVIKISYFWQQNTVQYRRAIETALLSRNGNPNIEQCCATLEMDSFNN